MPETLDDSWRELYMPREGDLAALLIGKCIRANPSPEGRGCREAAGEGYKNEEIWRRNLAYPSRPASAGHHLPSGEGFARILFPM